MAINNERAIMSSTGASAARQITRRHIVPAARGTARGDPLRLPPNLNGWYPRWGKAVFDRVIAAAASLVLAPVAAITAVAIRRKLGRGMIFRQVRIGRYGRTFTIYKFRTMLPDRRQASDRRGLARTDGAERRQAHKTDDDPRLTPLGRTLRATSLDELPQLLNVLRGEMSIVGPRPEVATVAERHYEGWQHRRHLVKPGITGLWQVTMRGRGDDGQMYRHTAIDIDYIERLSLRTDVQILVATARSLVRLPSRRPASRSHGERPERPS